MMTMVTAWRNLWRNKRRTSIIVAAIAIGIFGVQASMAFMNGWIAQSVENIVGTTLGYVQIQAQGYYENPSLKLSLPLDPGLKSKLLTVPFVSGACPRLNDQVLASNAERSEIAQASGTDPAAEPSVSLIPSSIIDGRWLRPDDGAAVVIGAEMAKRFKTRVGHRLVVRASRSDGELTETALRIVGIFRTGLKPLDRSMLYLPLPAMQRWLGLDGRVTEWIVNAVAPDRENEIKKAVQALRPGAGSVVTTWQEQQPILVRMADLVYTFMFLFNGFFFVAMAFGVANTMLMSVMERTKEFGVMLALGVRRRTIVSVIVLEALWLALFASAVGNGVSALIVRHFDRRGLDLSRWVEGMNWLGLRGILHPYLRPADIATATAATVLMALLMALYPAWKAVRLAPVEALRHV
jgi:ABC-type lipoprotein release transport system permease subunit